MLKNLVRKALGVAGYEIRRIPADYDLRLLRLASDLRSITSEGYIEHEFLVFCSQRVPFSKSQLFQDIFVDFILEKENGIFVEFGAFDGITYSNTYYLEHERGWTGILGEPTPSLHAPIKENRPGCILETRCVFKESGQCIEFEECAMGELSTIRGYSDKDHMKHYRKIIKTHLVDTISLNDLIKTYYPDHDVDYVSIDTEGSEFIILKSFNFSKFRPKIFTVEHNFSKEINLMDSLFTENGYIRFFRDISVFDAWYVRSDILESRFNGIARQF